MQIRPRRSVLYMPGSNARALEKAKSLPADALILDLEDAVAPEAKEAARAQVCAAAKAGGYGRREVVIRINGLDTPWGKADLEAAAAAAPDAVLVPKPGNSSDIERTTRALMEAGAPDKTRLWAMIETPLAILNLAEIAAASKRPGARLACFVMGTNDLVRRRAPTSRATAGRRSTGCPSPSRPLAPTASTCSTAFTTASRTSTVTGASACTAGHWGSTARR
jgi:citrate lyase subunit beta/citryl-CoA lyase